MAAVMLAVDIHNSSAAIAGIIENQLNDFNYIFPRQSKVSRQAVGNVLSKMILTVQGHVLIGLPLRGRPYRCSIILSVIRDVFFTGPEPFAAQHWDLFPSHLGPDGELVAEILKAMVALVSTAVRVLLLSCHHVVILRIVLCSTQ